MPDKPRDGEAHGDFLTAVGRLRVVLPGLTEAEAAAAILMLVEPWAGSPAAARDWATRVSPSLGASPAELLAEGRGALILDHLERMAHGGYA